MKLRSRRVVAVAGLVIALGWASVPASAQTSEARQESAAAISVPRLIQFNGTLKDSAGCYVTGVSSVTFAVYAEQDGGSPIWSETQNVLADSEGHFTTLLGAATAGAFPSALFSTTQTRWLGITVARQPEMPRVLLASVPYALKAGDADTLGGLPAASYVTTAQLAARNLLGAPISTIVSASGTANLPDEGGAAAAALAPGSATQAVNQATVIGTGTAHYLPLWTSSTNLGISKMYQSPGGFIGINTTTPLLQLDVNGNSIFRGSMQLPPQGIGNEVAGAPSHSSQWFASLFDLQGPVNRGFGLRAVPDKNNTANPTAKLDFLYGTGPTGSLIDTGLSISSAGAITFVPTQQFAGASGSFNTVSFTGNSNNLATADGLPFLGTYGNPQNLFLGVSAGGGMNESTMPIYANNVGIGFSALYNLSTGTFDTAVGVDALENNTTGNGNTAVGWRADQLNTTGAGNTAIGSGALNSVTTGEGNTAIGAAAGSGVSTGNFNTLLGGANTAFSDLQNATAIGWNASVAESNAMVLGGDGQFAVEVGIGTQTPRYELDIEDNGLGIGVLGVISSVSGRTAVAGYNNNASGAAGSNGGTFSSASPNAAGIVATNTGGGLAASFQGNVQITGTLTKGGGSFKIDDPIDPANKFLSHSFVESPDMMNLYNGIVTLDGHGAAVVTMPEWFSALNRDFRYTLTAIGAPAPKIYVAEEMQGNQFRIAGGKKGQKISWMVTGIRQDAWANAHRIPNEEEKPVDQQGKYLHPELFGAGPDQSIAPVPSAPPQNATITAASKTQPIGRD